MPEKNARICAYVLDDGEVKRVRVYFRSQNQDAYYWSEMAFDGIQFCATLPVARDKVRHIDYYVWSVDNEFQTARTSFKPRVLVLTRFRCRRARAAPIP